MDWYPKYIEAIDRLIVIMQETHTDHKERRKGNRALETETKEQFDEVRKEIETLKKLVIKQYLSC